MYLYTNSCLLVFDVGYVCKSTFVNNNCIANYVLSISFDNRERERESSALSQRNFVPSLTRTLEEKTSRRQKSSARHFPENPHSEEL